LMGEDESEGDEQSNLSGMKYSNNNKGGT